MADSGTKDFGSILSGGLYRIPNYQRGYAWTRNEVNDFLDDLEYVTGETGGLEEHYLNSIIVAETSGVNDKLHVIDGQQRLITASLVANEILRKTSSLHDDSDSGSTHLKKTIESKLYNDVFKTSPSETVRRVLPAEEHRSIYRKIVTTDIQSPRSIEKIQSRASSPSEQKLVSATMTIRKRIDNILDESTAVEGKNDELLFLDMLSSSLHSTFNATLHKVNNASEAGRIFEAINDRGRDLNRADKIKSYLVYRATLSNVDISVTKIHKTFTSIYDTLNKYASDPSEADELVDRLVGHHWNMFAGQNTIDSPGNLVGRHESATEEIEQIKYAYYHVPKQKEEDRIENWIYAYINSLEESAHSYIHTTGLKDDEIHQEAERNMESTVDRSKVRHCLYAIDEFGPSTIHCLLMAINIRFSDNERYEDLTEALEKLTLRMFSVGGARRDTKRGDFEALSRVLFWKGRDDITDVYPEDSRIPNTVENSSEKYSIEGNSGDIERVIELVEDWAYDYSHEERNGSLVDVFKERLENDNLDGLGVAGWGGISSRELKNYILYRYEAEIRSGGADLPDYLKAGIQDYTIEHVWPDEYSDAVEMDEDQYAHYVERLGNLALLSLSENSSAKNADYETKWNRAYESAAHGTKMFRDEFPDPTGQTSNQASDEGFETWSTDVIEWRSQKMAEVLSECWSVSE